MRDPNDGPPSNIGLFAEALKREAEELREQNLEPVPSPETVDETVTNVNNCLDYCLDPKNMEYFSTQLAALGYSVERIEAMRDDLNRFCRVNSTALTGIELIKCALTLLGEFDPEEHGLEGVEAILRSVSSKLWDIKFSTGRKEIDR
jgi:hypothetical protein